MRATHKLSHNVPRRSSCATRGRPYAYLGDSHSCDIVIYRMNNGGDLRKALRTRPCAAETHITSASIDRISACPQPTMAMFHMVRHVTKLHHWGTFEYNCSNACSTGVSRDIYVCRLLVHMSVRSSAIIYDRSECTVDVIVSRRATVQFLRCYLPLPT